VNGRMQCKSKYLNGSHTCCVIIQIYLLDFCQHNSFSTYKMLTNYTHSIQDYVLLSHFTSHVSIQDRSSGDSIL
jgi:hypothetical protein